MEVIKGDCGVKFEDVEEKVFGSFISTFNCLKLEGTDKDERHMEGIVVRVTSIFGEDRGVGSLDEL